MQSDAHILCVQLVFIGKGGGGSVLQQRRGSHGAHLHMEQSVLVPYRA
jgi:hypothetical protein